MSLRRAVSGVASPVGVSLAGLALAVFMAGGVFAAAVFTGGVLTGCGPQVPIVDISGDSPQMQSDYHLFAERCSRCHGLERALNARVSRGRWAGYVRRMSRLPGAGLSIAEQARITRFLEEHHHPSAGPATAPGTNP